jgi:hypothetical protein
MTSGQTRYGRNMTPVILTIEFHRVFAFHEIDSMTEAGLAKPAFIAARGGGTECYFLIHSSSFATRDFSPSSLNWARRPSGSFADR